MNTFFQNETESALANFVLNYPVEEIKGNFDDFQLRNDLDGHDIFGEIHDQNYENEVQEQVPFKHENDYLDCNHNFISEQSIIEDFDLKLLSYEQGNAQAEEIQYSMPIDYQVKIEIERFYAGQYTVDSHWQISTDANISFYSSPASSPCYPEKSSSNGPQLKSKRGRKPKDWENSNVIKSMINSAKNNDELNKTKNNISSGKYRKRKAMERKELDHKIALLEVRNQKLNERIQKNKLWFDSVRMLFPDITLPW